MSAQCRERVNLTPLPPLRSRRGGRGATTQGFTLRFNLVEGLIAFPAIHAIQQVALVQISFQILHEDFGRFLVILIHISRHMRADNDIFELPEWTGCWQWLLGENI